MKRTLSLVLALSMLLCGVAFAEDAATPEESYTYNLALSEFPTNWSPHNQQTATDSDVTQFIAPGLYTFDYNDTMDGYVMEPYAAADFPVDVTADYVGEEWGIEEGETARAWKIPLRDDLMWDDGTPITAQDFVDSAELLLNPDAQNYRADTMYLTNLVVTNAEDYAKQGVESDTTLRAYMEIAGAEDIDSFLAEYGELDGYINWSYSFGDTYDFATEAWTGAAEDAIVDTGLTLAELYTFYTEGAGGEYITWADDAGKREYALDELYAKYTPEDEVSFDSVGVKALSDTELVLILEKPLEGFYLWYSLTDSWLVKTDLYNECATMEDGVYNNTYGTSAETTASYGPYSLTTFQSDREYALTKNPYWFGYDDPAYEGQYQTTTIHYDYVQEVSTRLEMFLNGQLDSFGLDVDHIDEYGTSDYTYYSEGDSVFAMVFNPDFEALEANQAAAGENINKTILTVKDFRMAMSLAMNRAEFCLATSPLNQPAFALYGSQIVADPDNGIFYRNTDVAKNVVVNFWGLADEIGADKLYPTVDDAIDSITGYNLEMAKTYFDSAYDYAIENGLMDEDDVVQITVGTPNATAAFYNNGYDFIVNNYTEAVKGTKLEGKLTFTRDSTLGNAFSDALRNNNVDMLFGVGWTGSTFDPYNLMTAYTTSNYQYDPAWDTSTAMLDITIDDVTYTASVLDWTNAISGLEITATTADGEEATLSFPYSTDEHEAELRITVLGELENAVLQNYNFIPLMNDSGATVVGMQVQYYTDEEVFPMGYGGVQYLTYNYTDAEWEAYVAEQGGTLNYR